MTMRHNDFTKKLQKKLVCFFFKFHQYRKWIYICSVVPFRCVITILYKTGDNNFYCIPSTTSVLNRGYQISFNVENLTVKTVKVILSKSQGMPSKSKGI